MPDANPQTIVIGEAEIYLDNIYRHVRKLPPAKREDEIVTLIEKGMGRRQTSKEDRGFAAASNHVRPQIVSSDYLREVGDLVYRQSIIGHGLQRKTLSGGYWPTCGPIDISWPPALVSQFATLDTKDEPVASIPGR